MIRIADPALPPARGSDRRGDRLRAAPRRRVSRRRSRRDRCAPSSPSPGTWSSSAPGAPRGRDLSLPGRIEAAKRASTSASTGSRRCPSATSRRSAGASSSWAAATPRWTAAAARSGSAAATSRSSSARVRGDEGVALGKGRRDPRGHPDPRLPRAEGVPARQRQAHRHELRQGPRDRATTRAGASWCSTGEPEQVFECDDVLVAVGQENAFPVDRARRRHRLRRMGHAGPRQVTLQSSLPRVFFGGDAALGPKNIIWAVAHGHAAAISIDKFLHGEDVTQRPPPGVTLMSQKMGIHEWSYDNDITSRPALARCRWSDIDQVAEEHQGRGRARLRCGDGVQGGRALPQLRRADGVRLEPVHRMRRLRRHLPDRLHHLHRQRRRRPTCARACARRRVTPTRRSTSPTT